MTNDTAVFDAMRFDIRVGDNVWTGDVGTPDAILRDGLIVGGDKKYCPHEWLNDRGYVDRALAQKHPYAGGKS